MARISGRHSVAYLPEESYVQVCKYSVTFSCFIAANSLNAQSISYSFEGVVETPSPFLGDRFQVGDPVTGSFTYDSSTPDGQPGNMSVGSYLGSIEAFDFQIGDYSASISPVIHGDIRVDDRTTIVPNPRPHRDAYTAVALMSGEQVEGFDLLLASLQILDFDGDAITDDPITPPQLDLFSDPLITIDFAPVGSDQNRIWASLTSLQQVPEPASVALLSVGVIFIGVIRRPSVVT